MLRHHRERIATYDKTFVSVNLRFVNSMFGIDLQSNFRILYKNQTVGLQIGYKKGCNSTKIRYYTVFRVLNKNLMIGVQKYQFVLQEIVNICGIIKL